MTCAHVSSSLHVGAVGNFENLGGSSNLRFLRKKALLLSLSKTVVAITLLTPGSDGPAHKGLKSTKRFTNLPLQSMSSILN